MKVIRRRKNEVLETIEAELKSYGVEYTIEHGRKHYKIIFNAGGNRHTYVCSVSPSDNRAPRAARADIRRMMRQAGVNKPEPVKLAPVNPLDEPNGKQSQLKRIRAALEKGDVLTPMDALNRFGCFRLGARIFDLRKSGMAIETTRHKDGYAMYRANA